MTREDIMALEPGEQFNILVAEAVGYQWWYRKQDGVSALIRPGGDWRTADSEWELGEPEGARRIGYRGPRFTNELLYGTHLFFWLLERYGTAFIDGDMEECNEPYSCEVHCDGVRSWFAPLPVAVSRVVLMLHERDKAQEGG